MPVISAPTALLVATMDTKGQEALYIADCLKDEGISVCLLDAGIRGWSPVPVDVTRDEVAAATGKTLAEVQGPLHDPTGPELFADVFNSQYWAGVGSMM